MQAQEILSKAYRDLFDNAQVQVKPQMCIGTPPPPKPPGPFVPGVWQQSVQKQYQSNIMAQNAANTDRLIRSVIEGFLPHVCNKHVYRFDYRVIERPQNMQTVVYCKWTFFNDLDVKLELLWERDMGSNMDHSELRKSLTPMCDDYEAWMATAIMTCEAGEDVWARPSKPSSASFGGSAQQHAQQARAAQQNLFPGKIWKTP